MKTDTEPSTLATSSMARMADMNDMPPPPYCYGISMPIRPVGGKPAPRLVWLAWAPRRRRLADTLLEALLDKLGLKLALLVHAADVEEGDDYDDDETSATQQLE